MLTVTQWIVQGGATAMLAVFVWMILTGRLVPRSVLRDTQRDRDFFRAGMLKAMGQTDLLLPGVEVAATVARELKNQADDKAKSTDSFSAQIQKALDPDERTSP